MNTLAVGIDINGLQDVAAFDLASETIVGGQVPSVAILRRRQGRKQRLSITAGAEATNDIIGRGWGWPAVARSNSENSEALRVPVTNVLTRLLENNPLFFGGELIDPSELYVSALKALSNTRRVEIGEAHRPPSMMVAAIPDDGRFNEDAQQSVINASRINGQKLHLLWRSVAAVLGLAKQLDPLADRLKGSSIAVLSCLDDGISVNILDMDAINKNSNASYLVPVRKQAGRFFPFTTSITQHCRNLAERIAGEMEIDSEQVLWSDGLPLRWLLNLPERPSVFQSNQGWKRVEGSRPGWFEPIRISDELLDDLSSYLATVPYTILEGPLLNMPTGGNNLMFAIRDGLQNRRQAAGGPTVQTLTFSGQGSHLAARGCVEYALRRQSERVAYLDYLPQIRLAVRNGHEANFINLIREDAICEGGEEFDGDTHLGLSIPNSASEIEFYILREGNQAPRRAVEQLRTPVRQSTPIRMRVQQSPAQGRARLTIQPTVNDSGLSPITVNWDRMEVLNGKTEDEIVRLLSHQEIFAPPVRPHPNHAYHWVHKVGFGLLTFSLADHIDQLKIAICDSGTIVAKDIVEARKLLSRYQSPFAMSGKVGHKRHPDKTVSRAVSSDGNLPSPSEGLEASTLEAFDAILDHLATALREGKLDDNQRNQAVTFCTWAFARCPAAVCDHLRLVASRGTVRSPMNDFDAMGRAFTKQDEYSAFFNLLLKQAAVNGRLKNQHVRSLFYLLSLREDAPYVLKRSEADEFVDLTLKLLNEQITKGNYQTLMRTCLRALGGLTRIRHAYNDFLSPSSPAGVEAQCALKQIIRHGDQPNRIFVGQLAQQVLDVIQQRNISISILNWDGD